MLVHTFLHLPGVGLKKERNLWQAGITTWEDYERQFLKQTRLFPAGDPRDVRTVLDQSREALAQGDMDFFADRLPRREHYRIALHVPEQTLFLDIETTGLSRYYDEITLIGACVGDQYVCHVQGCDMAPLHELLKGAKCVVTFNGTMFDTKFLLKEFPDLPLPKAHVDLRFLGRAFGLRGGQKIIEELVGLKRHADIEAVVGERAPLLWHEYRLGDQASARMLVKYNHADIEGMKTILDIILERMRAQNQLPVTGAWPQFAMKPARLTFARSHRSTVRSRVFVPPYGGRLGPAVTYKDLVQREKTPDALRIVGIDLVGSESKPTGWCLLVGDTAFTDRIKSDLDIVIETMNACPDLVSIDSPLSLPKGRTRVDDSDPGRKPFGIVRECERTLMERGVNVYPCLINSMQALTARGIRLANYFRRIGIPVIESYPGAAQDIMGIPRKRAGVAYLKKGLVDFGIKGTFAHSDVTHDELDAVTAAAVGLFFWSGRFEGLGNEDEDYLIIPDLRVKPTDWQRRTVIGLSGPIAAGKTTGAEMLKEKGYEYGRYSMVLAEMLEAQGIAANRERLQELGDKVHRSPGQRWLSQQLTKKSANHKRIVIDGLRFPEDHAYLVERYGPGFRHIHVDASEEVRRGRYKAMGFRDEDFSRASAHSVEGKVHALSRLAVSVVRNDETRQAFARRLVRAITSAKVR